MPALDITGNFAAGQESTIRRRMARQLERKADYELDDIEEARRNRQRRREAAGQFYGYEVPGYEPVERTNDDPLWTKLMNWWRDRRATRVEPSTPATPSTQLSPIDMNSLPQRRTAIPTMADGGLPEDELARRNAANRARYESARAERALSPSQIAERRAADVGPVRRAVRATGRAAGRAGAAIAAPVTIGAVAPRRLDPTAEGAYTGTEEYRNRMGLGPSEREGIPRALEDLGVRAAGVMGDVGNALTGGLADKIGHWIGSGGYSAPEQAIPTAAQPSGAASEATPDQKVADEAIQEGTQMAQEAEQAQAPPGDIDFSKVDWRPDEIPNMTVGDWVQYRNAMVDTMLADGASMDEAMQTVTRMQQQNAVDYMSQAEYHLGMGNPQAAASALRMAFQYFPNGSDVQLGVYQDPETGQPALMGRGYNEETGEPVGNPMYLDSEKLAALRANFADPKNFLAWTKDWRDEAFREREFGLKRQEAQSEAGLRQAQSEYYRNRGQADLLEARARSGGASGVEDLETAQKWFRDRVEMLELTGNEGEADRLAYAMTKIKQLDPNAPAEEIVYYVRQAYRSGGIDAVNQALGRLGIE